MNYILFGSSIETATIGILIKESILQKSELLKHYITPSNIPPEQFIAFGLPYDTPKTCKAKTAKEYLANLLPELRACQLKTVLVCDPIYFKYLAKCRKITGETGELIPCAIPNYTDINLILVPNFHAVLFNPNQKEHITKGLATLTATLTDTYAKPGENIIHQAVYPNSIEEVEATLNHLLTYPALTCDIETTSLDHYAAQIESIAFASDQHTFWAFCVHRDRSFNDGQYIQQKLKQFFEEYQGTLIWHNAGYDCKILIYRLWLLHRADYPGLLTGLHIMTRNIEDTMLIAYTATNNAIRNTLQLKTLAASYTGSYAVDVTNLSQISTSNLLLYNGKDCLATWYVYNTYYPKIEQDNQIKVYQILLKPLIKTLLQMELCGMPIDPKRVRSLKHDLQTKKQMHLDYLSNSPTIAQYNETRLKQKAFEKTKRAKVKSYTLEDVYEPFNPSSTIQLQGLLYDYLGFPVLDQTKKKQPSTSSDTLKKLIQHTQIKEHQEIIAHLLGLAEIDILLSTFITAFEKAQRTKHGYRLYGSFKNGGTQSLRLSAQRP